MEDSNLVRAIGSLPLFAGLDANVVKGIATATQLRRLAAKTSVCWPGERPRAFYWLLSGLVRRSIASADGDEKLIEIVAAGQSFGLGEMYGSVRYLAHAETVTATELLAIERDGLDRAMAADAQLVARVVAALAERHVAFEHQVAASYLHSCCRRLLDFLIAEAGPGIDSPGPCVVKLPVKKGLLAQQIGINAATLSRAFRDLSQAGLIEVHGHSITLLDKLVSRHRAASSTNFDQRSGPPPTMQNRRRSDPWMDRSLLAQPIGTRAWL